MLVLTRTTRFQLVITSPGIDIFDNGQAQWISGYASSKKDAGLPTEEPLDVITINGTATTFSTNAGRDDPVYHGLGGSGAR